MRPSRRLALAGLVACAVFTAVAPLASAQEADSGAERFRLVIESPSLERRIAVGPARFRQVGRFEMFQVEATSTSRRQELLEYRVEWFDQDGFAAQTLATWQTLILSPSEPEVIQAVGQNANAYAARLTIREPERGR